MNFEAILEFLCIKDVRKSPKVTEKRQATL